MKISKTFDNIGFFGNKKETLSYIFGEDDQIVIDGLLFDPLESILVAYNFTRGRVYSVGHGSYMVKKLYALFLTKNNRFFLFSKDFVYEGTTIKKCSIDQVWRLYKSFETKLRDTSFFNDFIKSA